MARILLIETSTAKLSVALAQDGEVCASRISDQARQQASMTAPFVKEVLDELGMKVSDCDAVCVGSGPGSYTGLRVGVSTAKGLAFGADLPFIAIGSLEVLAKMGREESSSFKAIVPMIDARRMEVYTAVFSPTGERLSPVEAKIIDGQSFAKELAEGPVLFIGDGALKCREVLTHPGARFLEAWPDAAAMAPLAEVAYKERRFEDLAYFEPFYLKDFVATVSRKKPF